jgi:hypothetical protein
VAYKGLNKIAMALRELEHQNDRTEALFGYKVFLKF